MGQIEKSRSSNTMAKSSAAVKKPSTTTTSPPTVQGNPLDLSDPKIQGILLVGLLVVLALALWYGFTRGCMGRRRRRRTSCYQ